MTKTNVLASKLTVAFVAAAMIFSVFSPAAQAQTTEELQAMINDLLAQVAALQGQTGGDSMMAAGVCPFTWTRSLSAGSEGSDVKALQQFLNSDADTRVAVSGAGSAGNETMYYGPATAAAVSKFQVKYRADILSPVNLVNPTGYFGPSTISKANMLCVAGDSMEEEGEEGEEEEEEEGSKELSGEASLDVFEVNEEEDEITEGEEDVAVASFVIEFTDGDAEISRLDIALLEDGVEDTVGNAEPWEAFETVSLWVDGDKVAEEAADDEDEYLDEDDGTIRFSGLDIIGMEDEEVEVTVAVTVQDNLDATELGDWSLFATAIRYFDADDVATTDDSTDELVGDEATIADEASADFEVKEEGSEDELDLARSTNDPDEVTLIADEDEDYMIFAFELEADDSEGDIEIETIMIDVVLSSTTGALDDVINDFYIEIEGDKFKAETYVGTGDTATLEFDIDGDYTVEAEEDAEVQLFAEVEEMEDDSDYQGVTIMASLDTDQVIAEGVDNITVGGTDQDGEAHPIRSTGIDVQYDETESDTDVNGNTVTFEFVMDITAFGDDSILTTSDFNFSTSGPAGATATFDVSLDATTPADEDPTDTFTLSDGDTAQYTFKVFVTTDASADAGLYTVTLDDVDGTDVDESLDDVAQFSS